MAIYMLLSYYEKTRLINSNALIIWLDLIPFFAIMSVKFHSRG